MCHKVFPVGWLRGDKSVERVEARGIHFRLNAVYIKPPSESGSARISRVVSGFL